MAKLVKTREKILRRSWQLTELYNSDQECYITRVSGLIVDVGGEPRIWNLEKMLPLIQIQRSVIGPADVWTRHYEGIIAQAEVFLAEASAKVEAGEALHVAPATNFASTEIESSAAGADEGGAAGDDQGARDRGSSILDSSGNPVS